MFVPLIPLMEIESGGFEITNKKNKRKESDDFIYLLRNGNIFKVKVKLDFYEVECALVNYMLKIGPNNFKIESEKEINKRGIEKDLLKYIGKFRLEKNMLKTKNYLVPKETTLFNLLVKKSTNVIVTANDLEQLETIVYLAKEDTTQPGIIEEVDMSEKDVLEVIYKMFDFVDIEVVDNYFVNKNVVNKTIDNIEKIFGNNETAQKLLCDLKYIITSSNENKQNIIGLKLQNKFNEAIDLYEENSKKNNSKKKVK